jgi:alkylation response protein AidB-like acyl-CoA dehydrogenase
MANRTAKEFQPLETITAANLNKSAGGWLGDATNLGADQTGITTTTDITNCTVTVTVGTARRIKIECTALVTCNNTASWNGTIVEDGTAIGRWGRMTSMANGESVQVGGFVTTTPSAGSHTYKMQATVTTGGGNIDVSGTGVGAARILVTDIGPAT